MEQSPKTSFIPKQSMNTAPGAPARRGRTVNLFGFLAVVLFLGSLILSVGAFIYKQYSDDQLTKHKEQLAESRNSFEQGSIESIRELDRRMNAARSLLDQHLTVSKLFDVLERRIQTNLQFTSFAYERRGSGNASVELEGRSSRFNTVALQALQFSDEQAFDDNVFSDINIVTEEESGQEYTIFRAYAELNEDVVRYSVVPEAVLEEAIVDTPVDTLPTTTEPVEIATTSQETTTDTDI